MNITRFFTALTLISLFLACENKEAVPEPKPDDQESVIDSISWSEWPHTDCSTSTRPVRDLVAYKLLDVPYQWEVDWMSGTTYIIAPDFGDESSEFTYNEYLEQNLCSGTHGAYMNLIEGNTEVVIASRDISRNELQSSVEQGVPQYGFRKPGENGDLGYERTYND